MNLQDEIRNDLWIAIEKSYVSKIYNSAILDAIHFLSDQIRERANIDGDGASLVGQAFGGDNPPLRINKFQTETERDEQKGLEQILRGIYQGIRNPRSHNQIEDGQTTADSIILFINFLSNLISKSKEPFSLEEWKKKVFDKDFVDSSRYADILASEVPPNKIVEALVEIYRNKSTIREDSLDYIFSSLLALAAKDKLDDLFNVISDNLRSTEDETEIRLTLRILHGQFWPRINEAARLRVENKLIKDINLGQYNCETDKCIKGHLGTWAQGFITSFTLKSNLYNMFLKKLTGSDSQGKDKYIYEINYVANYFYTELPNTIDPSTNKYISDSRKHDLVKAIIKASSNSEAITLRKEFLKKYNLPEEWIKLIIEEIETNEYPPSDLFDEYKQKKEEEDIPF
jgi:uncharacterized protein (TIGR02391 family)